MNQNKRSGSHPRSCQLYSLHLDMLMTSIEHKQRANCYSETQADTRIYFVPALCCGKEDIDGKWIAKIPRRKGYSNRN